MARTEIKLNKMEDKQSTIKFIKPVEERVPESVFVEAANS